MPNRTLYNLPVTVSEAHPAFRWRAYLETAVLLAVIYDLRLGLEQWLHGRSPFLFFLPVVVFGALRGGAALGLSAAGLGLLAGVYVMSDDFPWAQHGLENGLSVLFYLVAVAIILPLSEQQRRLRQAAQDAAQARRMSEERMTLTLASIGDAVLATDDQGRVTFMNSVAEDLTGWTVEEARGHNSKEIFCIINEETRREVESPVERVLREGKVVGLANHTVLIARDGTERCIDDAGAPITGPDGRLVGTILTFRDITSRREAERRAEALNGDLSRKVKELQTLLDVLPIGIAIAEDATAQRVSANPALAGMLGITPDANASATAPPDEQPPYRLCRDGRDLTPDEMPMQVTAKTGQPLDNVPIDLAFPDGRTLKFVVSTAPLFDENGQPHGCICALLDVTERSRMEEELRRSEERFRLIAENAHDMISLLDSEGRYAYASPSHEKLLGYPLPLLLAMGPADLMVPEDRPMLTEWRYGERYQFRVRCADGSLRWVEALSYPITWQGQPYSVGIARDITDGKRHLEEVERLNQRLRRAMGETHHRVKNNLQVIGALVDLQVMEGREQVPIGEMQRLGRHIRSLAAIHDLLTQEAKSNGDVEFIRTRETLAKLMPVMQGIAGDRRINAHVDDMKLPIRQGTSLAVLVNELVSNAMKHGAGDIDLSLAAVEDRVQLEVADSGPGFPKGFDARSAANTGLELIQSISTWDLGGCVAYSNRPEGGAVVTITFPSGS